MPIPAQRTILPKQERNFGRFDDTVSAVPGVITTVRAADTDETIVG